jgi:ABC-type lipoprotein export system ATPase subunit
VDVKASEFLVIFGPTGCGKSTLLQILAGFLKPTRGKALVGGDPITGPSIESPRPRDITSDRLRDLDRQIHALLDEELSISFASEGQVRE